MNVENNFRRQCTHAAWRLGALVAVLSLTLRAAPVQDDRAVLSAAPADRSGDGIGELVADFNFNDLDGKPGRLSDLALATAVVVVLRVADDPDAPTQGAPLAALETSFARQGVAFVFVDPSRGANEVAARVDRERHGFAGRYFIDPSGRSGRALRARTSGELFVIDAARRLRFRGPVDAASESLRALLAGERIDEPARPAPGTPLELASSSADTPSEPAAVTWSSRIATIASTRCERCHCEGGAAPFALSVPEDFAGAAEMIRSVLRADLMPPWVATADSGPWKDDLRLRDDEKLDLRRWLQEGCPVGGPDFHQTPHVAPSGWQIGEPDLIVESPKAVVVPPTGIVDYMTLDAPSGLTEDIWVSAVQILCQHPEICHHIGVRQVQPDGRGQEFLAFYLPGSGPSFFPEGFALQLRKGATIRFDFHYTPNGTAMRERTRIGFKFSKEPPAQRISGRILSRTVPLRIPAGDPAHEVVYEHHLQFDTTLRRLIPHMHLRGKSVEVELIAPDGSVTRPLTLERWDPDWQFVYEFATPMAIAAGSTLRCRHLFDNSAANPRNPDPAANVRGGPQITDEMACIYFESYNRADEPQPKWRQGERTRRPPNAGTPAPADDGDGGR